MPMEWGRDTQASGEHMRVTRGILQTFRHSNYCHWSLYLTLWSQAQPYRLEKVTVN